ncbi:hypothetical protein KJ567_00160 [Candidatus Bipolaricaulota bacterium]|nr:hypothetical protein [Candidatus Bipolaricaulota bacterium]
MRGTRIGLGMIVLGLLAYGAGGLGQEVGPDRVIDAVLPILPVESDRGPEAIATGTIELPGSCEHCLVHPVQYRITVPEGVVRLVIELANTTDPTGDIDLIVREGQPVTEDEFSYYYSFRTYGETGEESLELPEEGLDVVLAGDYYIGIVSFVEPGTAFEIRAAAYIEQPLPDAIDLESNVPVIGQLQPGGLSGGLDPQYLYRVPEGAALAVVHASSRQDDIDLLVGRNPIERDEYGHLLADTQLRSSGLDELLVIGEPESGDLWIVVENDTPDRASYTLEVTSLPAVEELSPDTQLVGAVGGETGLIPLLSDYLRTDDGMLGLTQYRLQLPAGLTALRVRLRGGEVCDIRLHLRYQQAVSVSHGSVVADLSVTDGVSKEFVLQQAFIHGVSALYIALERLGEGEKAFSLEVVADVVE